MLLSPLPDISFAELIAAASADEVYAAADAGVSFARCCRQLLSTIDAVSHAFSPPLRSRYMPLLLPLP